MEAALSSIPPALADCLPKVLLQCRESWQGAQGAEVLSIFGDSVRHHRDPELGPAPRAQFTRLAKRLVQPRLRIRHVFTSVQSRQLQGNPPRGIADSSANSDLIEEKPSLLHTNYTNWNDGDPNRRPAFLESRGLHCCRDLTPPDMTRCVLSIPMDEQRTDPRFQCLVWAGHLPQILPFALNGATHSVCLQKPLQDSFEASIGTAVRDQSIGQLAHAVSLNGRYGCRSDRSITRFRAGRSEVGVGCPSDKSGTPGFR